MLMPEFSLEGKGAIITGGGRRARVLAQALAEAGANIALAPARAADPEGRAAVRYALGRGRKAWVVPVARPRREALEKALAQSLAELGRVDILVNNAEVEFAKPFLETTEEEWGRVLEANLTTTFLWSQVVGRHLVGQGKGRIINITSGLAVRGVANTAVYGATKAALCQMTMALALEWARTGVRVNAIGPGWMAEGAQEEPPDSPLLRYLPMKRRGRLGELGSLLVYLASDASDYVVGQTFFVDGGALAHA